MENDGNFTAVKSAVKFCGILQRQITARKHGANMSEQVIENNAGQTGAGTQASGAAGPIATLTQEIAQLKSSATR